MIIIKKVIFIGGPTGCGKSTLANNLNNIIPNSIIYRRYQGFFDIAKQRNIPDDEIFKQVTSIDVDDWFVNIVKNNEVVLSDVHYAVQMNRSDTNIDIYQNYVPTISKELINKLALEDIEIISILLTCSPEECLNRSITRYKKNGKDIRNISIEDASMENYAEEREWNNILSTGLTNSFILNSEKYNIEELTNQCLDNLDNKKEITLKKMI